MNASNAVRIPRRQACAWIGAVVSPTLLPTASAQGGAEALLEGRRFDTTAGLVGKPMHVPSDILSFQAGLFHSSDCDQYEYGKGRYSARSEGDAVHFEAETTSPSYGRNVWKGVVRGQAIEGEFVFHRKPTFWRPNPEPLVHWFKGPELPRRP
jgi:hypothetical protein